MPKELLSRRSAMHVGLIATLAGWAAYEFGIPGFERGREVRYPEVGWLDAEIQVNQGDHGEFPPFIDRRRGPQAYFVQSVSRSPTLFNVFRRVKKKEYMKPLPNTAPRLGDDLSMMLHFAGEELLVSHPFVEPSWRDKFLVASRVYTLVRTDYAPFSLIANALGHMFEDPVAYDAKKDKVSEFAYPRIFPVEAPRGTTREDENERFRGTDKTSHLAVGLGLADAFIAGKKARSPSIDRMPRIVSQKLSRFSTDSAKAVELTRLAADYWEDVETFRKPLGRIPYGWRDSLAHLDVQAAMLGARARTWLEQNGHTDGNVAHVIGVLNDPRVTNPLSYNNPYPDTAFFEGQFPL